MISLCGQKKDSDYTTSKKKCREVHLNKILRIEILYGWFIQRYVSF